MRTCDPDAGILHEFKAHMRYVGQGWEIPVDLDPADALQPEGGRFRSLFETAYRRLFGRIVDGLDIEITNWSVNASTPAPPADAIGELDAGEPAGAPAGRALFDPASGGFADALEVARDTLDPGRSVAGPAVITERETSVIVPAGFVAVMQTDGCITVGRAGAETHGAVNREEASG